MKRIAAATATLVSLAMALAPVAASDSVCRKGEIEFGGTKAPILAFAWEEKPAPLSKGIMFETLMDRPTGDSDFVSVVGGASCDAWGELPRPAPSR